MKYVVVFNVDESQMEELRSDLDQELDWLRESGVYHESIFEIPEELSDKEAIETIWLSQQIEKILQEAKKEHPSIQITKLVSQLVQELHDNHETVDQDLDWRVREWLKEKYKLHIEI